jgi:hypothetical protein
MVLSEAIERAMTESLGYLAGQLGWEVIDAPTHQSLIITGWDNSDETKQAIARYLVGLRVCAMDAALEIKALLENTEKDRAEVLANVLEIVGKDNSEDTRQKAMYKRKKRNPWIAEGVWHICLAVAHYSLPELHPSGEILALNYAHVIAEDHGLDVAAIYQSQGKVGLSLIESKAYRNNVNKAISDCVSYFREVNEGIKHALRIRQTVHIMRASLSEEVNHQISRSFWKKTRAYLPNPHYDASLGVDWTNSRPSLSGLKMNDADIEVILVPNAIVNFDHFFDEISEAMRVFAREIADV